MNERYRVKVHLLGNKYMTYHVFAETTDMAETLVRHYVQIKQPSLYIVSVVAERYPAAVTFDSVRILPIGKAI